MKPLFNEFLFIILSNDLRDSYITHSENLIYMNEQLRRSEVRQVLGLKKYSGKLFCLGISASIEKKITSNTADLSIRHRRLRTRIRHELIRFPGTNQSNA